MVVTAKGIWGRRIYLGNAWDLRVAQQVFLRDAVGPCSSLLRALMNLVNSLECLVGARMGRFSILSLKFILFVLTFRLNCLVSTRLSATVLPVSIIGRWKPGSAISAFRCNAAAEVVVVVSTGTSFSYGELCNDCYDRRLHAYVMRKLWVRVLIYCV